MRIRVADRGLGIDAADLPHIFKPFYRGRRGVDAQVRGTGVGLSVVRHVIAAHHATIAVDSRVGEGTTVTISLPPLLPPGAAHASKARDMRSPRVLLVEDEAGLRLTLSDRLGSEGYSVETASDGEAGLARATTGGYDLIVLDVMLPRMNGFDVCREVRQRGVTTPILMLTARGQVVDKVVGLKLGADDYLTKPFETIELMARLEALLRRVPSRRSRAATATASARSPSISGRWK